MKQRSILIIAIILTLLIEITLIILVFNKVGNERLPGQIGRLAVQLILITWVLSSKSNTALFILMAYHIIIGFLIYNTNNSTVLFGVILIIYHFAIGLIIYFHDWIEQKLKINKL